MGAAAAPIMIASTVAQAGMQAYGQHQAGKAAKRQGQYEARILEFNAGLAESQASDALARGREVESLARTDTKRLIGSQRTALAAQGIEVGSGSAVDVQADAAALGEQDALTIREDVGQARLDGDE